MDEPVRLLHVDDDPDLTELTATYLERADERFAIETATNVSEGVARLSDGDFDCIVSDYDMPERDGIEFLGAVREDYPDLPFVLFTGKGSEEVASEAISAGVTDYLQKTPGTEQYTLLANRIKNAVAQYRAEQEVKQTEDRYRHLIEESTDVIIVVDASGTFQYLSPAADRVLGYAADEMVGENAFDYVHPDDRERLVAEFATQVEHPDERVTTEFRFDHPDGGWQWMGVKGRNLLDAPIIDGIVVYARDITERKKRERELELYETIVENTEDGIYVGDADCRFEFVNQRVAEASGIPQEAWLGEHVSMLSDLGILTDSEVASLEEGFEAIIDGARDQVSVEVAPRVPEEDFVIDLRLTSLQTERPIDSVVGFSRNVTERKKHEQELERKNERLEEFASVVSHDLRNPLNVAEGRLELIREECDGDHLDEIADAHQRMRTLIDDLLTLARGGDTASDAERIDLAETVDACWRNVETERATLDADATRTFRGDRSRVRQLLENLLRNAVDHGGTDVTVTVGDLEDGFYVADDGPGIPDEEAAFEAGYSTAEEGTGYGLTIVRRIADAHGWAVDATDSEAGGARFEFTGLETEAGRVHRTDSSV
ncbi:MULTISPECIES: PAS domain S-box protein [Halorussus]|uniref:PAS domain S-box protein n=1 Tax=Halorussus TaxID=1070314 RepID=UPI000E20DE19|nr:MULTISPECIES: PAS domain S-box protein [Halorussus]NHN61268.1 PAS domain S-box protein [Halorussus sp. JP-T4]